MSCGDHHPDLFVICCAVMETEVAGLADDQIIAGSVTLAQGLHDEPDRLRAELQAAIDQAEADPDVHRIALVYGLCSRGIDGVRTTRCSLAVTRAHDCITLLLGDRHRYADYIAQHPGTYWYSPGWNRHHIPPGRERYEKRHADYTAKYGEENAEYLMEVEQHWYTTYDRATYVHLTVGASEHDKQYTRNCADWLNWHYDEQTGDPTLLRDLLHGHWDNDRYLVLQPGQTIQMTGDERIIAAASSSHPCR